jgi:arylsulfatase A-like enzyme
VIAPPILRKPSVTRQILPAFAAFALLAVPALPASAADSARPNILVILADDLGYGDVKCFNPEGKIATPNLDRLAAAGMMFTDAHTGSAVCSPTRYGLITGRYAWRSKLKSGVLGGLSPRLVEPGRFTLAQMLKDRGYHTAAIGKWHLGMDWALKPGKQVSELSIEPREQVFNVEYDQPIKNGPNSVGFDYYFGISASLDMVPYTFIENDHVTANPTEDRDFPLFLGRPQGRCRKGPAAPGFEVEGVLPALKKKALEYIDQRAKEGKPFFLYLPLASPHTPIAPLKEWQDKSGLNHYADFVMETDAAVGEVLAALDRHKLADNTLVIFTSDNGCSPQANFPALMAKGHNPSYHFRGHKADIYEGGHRVPFIVRWPGKVKPGTRYDGLASLVDITATCADVVGAKFPDSAAEDSISLLPALGVKEGPVRKSVVVHSVNGSFAIREGKWKLCLCPGSGGWSAPRPGVDDASRLPPVQLFDLSTDIGEKLNLHDRHPDIVKRLTALLEKHVADGRSTPGTPQQNTTPVDIRKAGTEARRAPKKKKE